MWSHLDSTINHATLCTYIFQWLPLPPLPRPPFRFIRNTSPSTGGGLHFTFLSEDTSEEASQFSVTRTRFTRNQANFGGGAFFFPLSESLSPTPNAHSHCHTPNTVCFEKQDISVFTPSPLQPSLW